MNNLLTMGQISILYIGNSADEINALNAHPGISLTHKIDAMAATAYLRAGNKPNAILCELNLAGGDGFGMHDLLRNDLVRGDQKFKYVSFILLCNEFQESVYKRAWNQEKRAYKQAIDDFYILPLTDIDGIVTRIHDLINYRKIGIVVGEYHMPLVKKLFDIVVASLALICLSPLLLAVAAAIFIESKGKGKIYYTSERMGTGLDPFLFYKLRSMRVGSDKQLSNLAKDKNQYASAATISEIDFSEPCPECAKRTDGTTCSELRYIGSHEICDNWYTAQKAKIDKSKPTFIKISNDPRVTRVGKFIRNTSIDELPQLINVIKGDMSIVGNRPLPVYEGKKLTNDEIAKRFLAPAGITGLWQVELRGKGGIMSESERHRYDNEYADHFARNNYSFWYDLKLILRTFPALFQKDPV